MRNREIFGCREQLRAETAVLDLRLHREHGEIPRAIAIVVEGAHDRYALPQHLRQISSRAPEAAKSSRKRDRRSACPGSASQPSTRPARRCRDMPGSLSFDDRGVVGRKRLSQFILGGHRFPLRSGRIWQMKWRAPSPGFAVAVDDAVSLSADRGIERTASNDRPRGCAADQTSASSLNPARSKSARITAGSMRWSFLTTGACRRRARRRDRRRQQSRLGLVAAKILARNARGSIRGNWNCSFSQ